MLYSYLDGVTNYRVDVPDGDYKIALFFIEPEKIEKGDRVFDVRINKQKVIDHLDLAADYGVCVANEKTFKVKVSNGDGIEILFSSIKGKPILNGITIAKQ